MTNSFSTASVLNKLSVISDRFSNLSIKSLSILAVLISISGMPLLGQGVTSAGISGIINDTSGETLPGATILAIHTPTGTQYGASTGVDGQ